MFLTDISSIIASTRTLIHRSILGRVDTMLIQIIVIAVTGVPGLPNYFLTLVLLKTQTKRFTVLPVSKQYNFLQFFHL